MRQELEEEEAEMTRRIAEIDEQALLGELCPCRARRWLTRSVCVSETNVAYAWY